jgi:hypothetical protein
MRSQFEVHRAKDCAIFKFPLGISAEADEIIKVAAVCTENLIRVDAVMESRKLTE